MTSFLAPTTLAISCSVSFILKSSVIFLQVWQEIRFSCLQSLPIISQIRPAFAWEMNLLQWLMKGLGMAKKKLINLSKEEENINGDCQSIEELKGWRFNWRKIILLEPTAELIILVLLALLYGGFYYYDHYTVNEDNIYGLWQSDHHKLAISYKHIRKRGNIDWQVIQDGKYIIHAARTRPVKRLNDGTLHMELYTVEGYLTDLPTKDGFSYMDFYLRKNNYLTYDGESYKRINSGNKSITWKDGSTSPYGERKTTIDEVFEALYLILMGICSVLIITEARQKRREKLSETPIKKKIR